MKFLGGVCMDNIQYFDWGYIEWIFEPKDNNSIMYVGLSTAYPGKTQPSHIHYGNEQLMYIIEGEGEQVINGVHYEMKPGMIFHVESGSSHESTIYGTKHMKKLLISVPELYSNKNIIHKKEEFEESNNSNKKIEISLSQAITYTDETILSKTTIPITIFDKDNNLVFKSKHYPQYCIHKCNIDSDPMNCYVLRIKEVYKAPQYSGVTALSCPYGLTIFILPIIYKNEIVGYIKSGHIKDNMNDSKDSDGNLIYDTPKSTSNRIMSIMNKIKDEMNTYFDFSEIRHKLLQKDEMINFIEKDKGDLELSLSKLNVDILNIQINNHFLFNTLNAIANLAMRDNSIETYTAIVELSRMFRYSVRKSGDFIPLKDEVEYIRNYMNLQKLRYRDNLLVTYNVDLNLYDILVPFNILQPLVENSFKHGFRLKKDMLKIDVDINKVDDKLVIKITDNGDGMDDKTLDSVLMNLKYEEKLSKNGLAMIYTKLVTFYDERFSFNIKSEKNKFTQVIIALALVE